MESSSTLNSSQAVTNALTLSWAFGFNKDVVDGVHSLCTDGRQALFYVAAHTGVIYDYEKRTQELLQGHCNPICAVAVSHNKKWVVTADAGHDSMMVVWDTASASPIKSTFNPHPNGVIGMDVSPDSMFIVTLSAPGQLNSEIEGPQTISLWEWTNPEKDGALFTSVIEEPDIQKVVKFNKSDIRQIMTTGDRRTMFWSWESGDLRGYVPRMSRHDFKKGKGVYTACCFLPGTKQSITATSTGEIVLWEEPRTVDEAVKANASALGDRDVAMEKAQLLFHTPKRHALKVLKLCDGAIVHVSTVSGGYWAESDYATSSVCGTEAGVVSGSSIGRETTYVVVAGEDGVVRFYDLKFRLEAWFEDFDAGGVTSVSFAAEPPKQRSGESESTFRVPDFVVGTEKAYIVACAASAFEEIDSERRRGTVIVQGMVSSVNCVASHPKLPMLVILSDSGDIQLWDYNLKVLVTLRPFDPSRLRPQSGAFHPEGTVLAVGFSSGVCKILDASDLDEVVSFRCSSAGLTMVRFSPDGQMVAACDTENHVYLFKHSLDDLHPSSGERCEMPGTPEDSKCSSRDSWAYIGRFQSHARRITGLEFGTREDGRVSLVSVAEDKYLVEYNLTDSTQDNGLLIAEAPKLIEQRGLPSALMWHPLLGSDFEDRLVTANNEYKLKEWNADNKGCRKTSLGPTFGGPINRLLQINRIQADGQSRPCQFAAYGTPEKVIGLVQMPFDGNSRKMMGLIAHPGEISSLTVSGDGSYLMTSGGRDLTVNMWKLNTQVLENASARVSAGNESHIVPLEETWFLEQLQGGKGGELHQDIMDYFSYALLRTQGEDATVERSNADNVPLSEVPNIMRALGYYPTEQEVVHMLDEVKYSRFTETGKVEESLDLNGLIRLFLNHRSVFPITNQMVSDAFMSMGGDFHDDRRLAWSTIRTKLKSMGEGISDDELVQCLEALVGDSSTITVNGRTSLQPLQFAQEVLGFEDHHQYEGRTGL